MPAIDLSLHPRPQLARERWIDLCGDWDFAFDDTDSGRDDRWPSREDVFDRTITVPFPPESPASGIADPSFHPVVWYRRTFERPPANDGGRLVLHVGAVDYRASVWVNGQLVAEHEGGHTPFEADITGALVEGQEQVVVVRAEDVPTDLEQPRGKQDWEPWPHAIWYHRTTGIWQPVWLEPVAPVHIAELRWRPDADRSALRLTLRLSRAGERSVQVRVRLELYGDLLVDDMYSVDGKELQREIALGSAARALHGHQLMWSPGSPNLIDATVSVLVGGEVVDTVSSYTGLRSVHTHAGKFLLNGDPCYLRFALAQGYWPESHLAAPSEDALRREVELAKELGFNGIRIHQKVEDPRFLYWCDRLGLMVWGEMANAYAFSESAAGRLVREWQEVVARDISHPCIIAWVPMNESWGTPNLLRDPLQRHFVQTLYHLTKSMDPTRPVLANDGWEFVAGDFAGVHDYGFDGASMRLRYADGHPLQDRIDHVLPAHHFLSAGARPPDGAPFIISEFGGISYRPAPGAAWVGYGTVSTAEAYVDKYRELVEAIMSCGAIAGFCYTQLTDTGQETNGLLTEAREFKVDPVAIRALNRRPPAAALGDMVHAHNDVGKVALPPGPDRGLESTA